MNQMIGKQTIKFEFPPAITGRASIVGSKEGLGPLASYFDQIEEDDTFGSASWELAESEMINRTVKLCLVKSAMEAEKIRYIFGGDLLGQLIGTTFGIKDYNIPLFGLYGACSTCGEALSLAAMTTAAGYADHVIAFASSHFASAEKQFRYPLDYGSQRPLCATWTVTGCGAFIVSRSNNELLNCSYPRITSVTTGKIVDYGVTDSMNMGACMAPAAADVIYQCLKDLGETPSDFDKIITGDLGKVGSEILIKLLKDNGYDISLNHMDCGIEIFDNSLQDTHSGGSGCGCSAATMAGYILHLLNEHELNKVMFIPTGALLSPVSYNEGQSIPGIAHALVIEQKG